MKIRLDELLVRKKIAQNIKESQALIMSGKVLVENIVEDKVGMKFDEKFDIRLKTTKKTKYVSRGGLKLEEAIKYFNINLSDLVCMDVGCSTGGFTQVLLEAGVKKIFAVDVGVAQLDWKIRTNKKVVVLEKTNIKRLIPNDEISNLDFICIDVSFISVKTFAQNIKNLMRKKAGLVILIKPQFEAKKYEVGSGGIVFDEEVRNRVVEEVISAYENIGFKKVGVVKSPIKGAKGNIEFLLYMING